MFTDAWVAMTTINIKADIKEAKRVIDYVRVYLELPVDVTDDMIADELHGTLLEARVKLHFATEKLAANLRKELLIAIKNIRWQQ